MRVSFRLNPIDDKDIIVRIESLPEREKSKQIKKWIRDGIKTNKDNLSLKSDRVIKWNFPK